MRGKIIHKNFRKIIKKLNIKIIDAECETAYDS